LDEKFIGLMFYILPYKHIFHLPDYSSKRLQNRGDPTNKEPNLIIKKFLTLIVWFPVYNSQTDPKKLLLQENSMITAITLFPKSMDIDQIEEFISSNMIPSLTKAPGFLHVKTSEGHLMSPAGPPDYSKVLEFSFQTLEDFYAWTQASEEQPEVKDQMIKDGVVMLFYEEVTL
jgi:hypothetical protein